jgi:hypothetical protein
MLPPNLGDSWIPKILISIDKETHHNIVDLGSSVSVISKELFDLLNLKKWKNNLLIYYLLMIQPKRL